MKREVALHLQAQVLINDCLLIAVARALRNVPGLRENFEGLSTEVIETADEEDAARAAAEHLQGILRAVWGESTPAASS
ncbi:MAG: hypothetical protein IT516_12340 [Burkholderiales bacterium]|nr:hypothetical protein [Burkholderiales bacterium]